MCKVYKVNNHLQILKKTTRNKINNTHFPLKEKNIHEVFLLYLLVGICLLQCSFSFLAEFVTAFGEALAIVTKCSILDIAGILNLLLYMYQHELHVQTILFKCLVKDNNWYWWSYIWTEHKVVIRLSLVKKWDIHWNAHWNVFHTNFNNLFSNCLREKITNHFYNNRGWMKGNIWLAMSID